MMNSLSNVRQTRSQTRFQQANVNLNPGDDDKASSKCSEDSFIPSRVDEDGGELCDCAGCNRPNNTERYMVQCGKCERWYHFTCVNVNTATVHSVSFVCAVCMPVVSEPAHSQISGISGTSSAHRSRVERELQRLEEERKLLEDLNRERIARERALNEKELQEKLEQGKQFIARKHELLNRKDGEEGNSVRSMRSSQRSAKRTEDWVRQTKAADEVIGGQIPASSSVNADLSVCASSGNLQVVHPSSTPLRIPPAISSPVGDGRVDVGLEAKSIPRTLGSITIGSEDSLEGAVGGDAEKDVQRKGLSDLPFVDLQPYADLLKVEEIVPSASASVMPGINRIGTHYKRWSVETGELRKQQRQSEAEHRAIQDLVVNHQLDIDTRRKREVELVNQIKSLQWRHGNELQLIRESEKGLRVQLNQRDREQAVLKVQVETLEKLIVEEKERSHATEVKLQDLVMLRNKECEALQLQLAELESEIQCLRDSEQLLKTQLEAAEQRENESQRLRNEAMKEYWDLHDEVQQFISGTRDGLGDSGCSPPLPPPPASWFEPSNEQNIENSIRVDSNHAFPPPPHPLSVDSGLLNRQQEYVIQPGSCGVGMMNEPVPIPPTSNTFPSVPTTHRQIPSPTLVPAQFGPTPQQIAARQVVTRELPIFSGDPIDWPLFISSYQHSTQICGYTASENLLRLQRSLKGSAKDSVSSFLLHPSTVPQVMSTLQQLYGRPEQIVNNMIAKVRATPPPKPDRLETLVSFGLIVQNLCGHLKAVGLERHLANPILLQELVDKLPATVKFSWALYQEQVPMVDLNVFSD